MEYSEEEFLNTDQISKRYNLELLDTIKNCTDEKALKYLIFYRDNSFQRQVKNKKYREFSDKCHKIDEGLEKRLCIAKLREFADHMENNYVPIICYADLPDNPEQKLSITKIEIMISNNFMRRLILTQILLPDLNSKYNNYSKYLRIR